MSDPDTIPAPAPDLLPCPFCGGDPKLLVWLGEHSVECIYCEVAPLPCDTEAEAIAVGNRRAPAPAPDRVWVVRSGDYGGRIIGVYADRDTAALYAYAEVLLRDSEHMELWRDYPEELRETPVFISREGLVWNVPSHGAVYVKDYEVRCA